MIYVVETVSGYGNAVATTNFSKALSKIEHLLKDTILYPVCVEIWTLEGEQLDIFIVQPGQEKEQIEKDFVLYSAKMAKQHPTIEVIEWAEKVLKAYDVNNPTIDSMIYSLYMKYQEKTKGAN